MNLLNALDTLGFNTYHLSVMMKNGPPDAKLVGEALDAVVYEKGGHYTRQDFDKLLGNYDVSDRDISVFYLIKIING